MAHVEASLGGLKLDGFYIPDRQQTVGKVFDALTSPEATANIRLANDIWQTRATFSARTGTLFDLRYGGYQMTRDQDPQAPNTRDGPPARFDLDTGATSGNTTIYRSQRVTRHIASGTLSHSIGDFLGGAHAVGGGFEYEQAQLNDVVGYPGAMALFVSEGVVASASLWNGVHADLQTRRATVFATDDWAATNALTISGGIRLDVNHGSAGPRQGVVRTTSVSPRIGVAWQFSGSSGAVAKLHYGRYHDPVYTDLFFYTDPDSEADERIVAVVPGGELLELDRHEPPFIVRATPQLNQPGVDQLTASFERDAIAGIRIDGRYIGRRFVNFIGVAADPAAYEPVSRPDPGPDGQRGTTDDGEPLTVFNRRPVSQTYVITNPPNASRQYHGLQVVAKRSYVRGWQMQLSYTGWVMGGNIGNSYLANSGTGGSELGPIGAYVNPNKLINADGWTTPNHELKALGTYRVPFWGGWHVSSVFRRAVRLHLVAFGQRHSEPGR